MFFKLQRDAMTIDNGIKKLYKSIPNFLNNYTYNRTDNQAEIIREREATLQHVNDEVTEFLEANRQFKQLYLECTELTADVSDALNRFLADPMLNLATPTTTTSTGSFCNNETASPSADASADYNSSDGGGGGDGAEDKENLPRCSIARKNPISDMPLATTPAIRSVPKQPLANVGSKLLKPTRITFLRENYK